MKHLLVSILTALSILLSPALAFSAVASADCSTGTNPDAKGQVLQGISQNTSSTDCTGTGVSNTVAAVVNILSYVVGIISVIAIISGAFKYITSGGDSSKVGNARSTIMYAIVGIIIVVLAQLIVRVVITSSNSAAHNCDPNTQHYDAAIDKCVAN